MGMVGKYVWTFWHTATREQPVFIEVPSILLGILFDLIPDMPPLAAYSFYAIFLFALLFMVPYEIYKKTCQERDAIKKKIEDMINPNPDTWLYDVMVYIVEKKWGGEIDCVENTEFINTVFRTLGVIQQKAADGYLPIWGRQYGYQTGALEKLDKKYWITTGFDEMSFYLPNKEECKTETMLGGVMRGASVFWNLKTSKSIVEAIWQSENT